MKSALTFALLAFCAAPSAALQRPAGEVLTWEHETSDVPVDPRIQFGAFDNGLRYAWATNPEPEERSYLRLHVAIGSLAETDAERGMAHFLEHMAFNGSENFPAGTLIEWFQEHGMAFGPDTNAGTSFYDTTYEIDLPESDPESLGEGLMVLRDYADGLLLEEEEVEAEKGVIDGEERERDSPGFRVFQREMEERLAGMHVAKRLPIGTKAARDAFTPESVRAFYKRWYRPENMTLVLVGDFDIDPAPLFEKYFADLAGPQDDVLPMPSAGEAQRFAFAYSIFEEEIPTVRVSVQRLEPWVEEPFTKETWTKDLPLDLAHAMLNLRFSELAKEEDTPYLGAGVSDAEWLRVLDGEGLAVTSAPEKWEEAFGVAVRELRRALQFGFQEAELAELRADWLRGLDEAVEREPTAHSGSILGEILAAADGRFVPTNAETYRALLRPAIEATTVETCHAALVEAWDIENLDRERISISAVGNLDLGENAGEQLLAAWEACQEEEIEKGEEIIVADFAYASDPEQAGEIVARAHVEDLDFHQVAFANGVTLNIKATDFKEQQILLQAALGEGRLTAERAAAALVAVGSSTFTAGGLVAHDTDELRRLTAGRLAGVRFGVSEDRFVLGGSTTAEDLAMQCELMCAYMTAPGWRDEGIIQYRRGLPQFFEGRKYRHSTPVSDEFYSALYSGDPRVGMPSEEDLTSIDVKAIQAWLTPHLADAPLEVTFVGELDVEEVVAVAARTFGALPERRAWREYSDQRGMPTAKTGLRQTHEVETDIPKTLVHAFFPTTDGIDRERSGQLDMLGVVVNDRLRLEVREKLGASYSPQAGASSSTVHPGYGSLVMQAMAEPDGADELVAAFLDVAATLAEDGTDEEELERLREPMLPRLRDARRRNGFWLEALGRSHREPESLDRVRNAEKRLLAITADQVSALAKEYLDPERASVVVVHPKSEPEREGQPTEASGPAKESR